MKQLLQDPFMWFYNTDKANETASKNVQVDLVKASKFGEVLKPL